MTWQYKGHACMYMVVMLVQLHDSVYLLKVAALGGTQSAGKSPWKLQLRVLCL